MYLGGGDGRAVATELVDSLCSAFYEVEKVYKDDVSFALDDFMDSHFHAVCEDESTEELGLIMGTRFTYSHSELILLLRHASVHSSNSGATSS
jgi:hypothetical protein